MPETVDVTADNAGKTPMPSSSQSFMVRFKAGLRTRNVIKMAAAAAAVNRAALPSQELCRNPPLDTRTDCAEGNVGVHILRFSHGDEPCSRVSIRRRCSLLVIWYLG
jgi:hypothetical protein